MKKLLPILLLINVFFCAGQSKHPLPYSKSTSTNTLPSVSKKYNSASTQNGVNSLPGDTCLEKKFSIVFYVVQDSTPPVSPNYPGITPATPSTLTMLTSKINDAFKPICLSFENCSTVYIPYYSYGKKWKKNFTEPIVTANYYTDKTLNFFIVDSLDYGFGNTEPEGYTYEPSTVNLNTPKKDLLVMTKAQIIQGNGVVAIHLLGHYFGLLHTYDEINVTPSAPFPPPAGIISQEYADETNCYQHGDGFCDTEADPNNVTIVLDGMGTTYLPPTDNFMSLYSARNRFTQEQFNFMAHLIITKRLYLH